MRCALVSLANSFALSFLELSEVSPPLSSTTRWPCDFTRLRHVRCDVLLQRRPIRFAEDCLKT